MKEGHLVRQVSLQECEGHEIRSRVELAKALRGIEGEAAGDNLAEEIESLLDNVGHEEIKSCVVGLIAKADQMKD